MNLDSIMRKKHFLTLVIVAAIWLLLVIAKSMDTPNPLPWEVANAATSSIAPSTVITSATSITVTAQIAVTTTQAAQASAPGVQIAAQTATGDPAKGKQLFASTCAACHGPEGRGNGPARWPQVRAQQPAYVTAQLQHYAARARYQANAKGTPTGAELMYDIAKRLTEDDIKALTAYLQGLR